MKCWKCGGHMTRDNGWATCDDCGRTVSYQTGRSSSGGSDSCLGSCLGGCAGGCAQFILYGIIIIGIIILFAALFFGTKILSWIF